MGGGVKVPRSMMANPDVARLINSDEVQSVVNMPKTGPKPAPLKKNPLKNLGAMIKLNPYAKVARKQAMELQTAKAGVRKTVLANMAAGKSNKLGKPAAVKKVGKEFVAAMRSDHSYTVPTTRSSPTGSAR